MFGIDDALVAGGLAAGAGFLGNWSANSANRDINRKNNKFNAEQAQLNRDWQERMSNTAYQRARKDMEAAGFNPILAAGGSPASSPSGSSASAQASNPQTSNTRDTVSSAKDSMMMQAQLDLVRQQAEATRQQGNMYGQQANLNMVNMNNAVTQGSILENQLPASALQAHIDTGDYGLALAYAKRLNLDFGTAVNLIKMLPNAAKSSVRTFLNRSTRGPSLPYSH